MPEERKNGVQIPADLGSLSDEELDQLETDAVSEFDALDSDENIDTDGTARMSELADGIEAIRSTRTERAAAIEQANAERESLRGRVHAAGEDGEGEGTDDGDGNEGDGEGEAVTASARQKTDVRNVLRSGNKLNVRLSQAQARVPGRSQPKLSEEFARSVLVASADIPGFTTGGQLNDMDDLVRAFISRARALPITRTFAAANDWQAAPRYPVASIQRQFRHTLGLDSSPQETWDLMQEAANPSALVAAGGWCSPSEISYDFFDIADIDGLVDIPTIGINRGGLRWPVSPSYKDVGATCTWYWNETMDVAAATGTAQSGTKTCCRVPCATMNEARLILEGLCVTAGNLTADAWPEMIANYLHLVNVAHARRINSYVLAQMVAGSIAVSVCATGQGLTAPVLNATEMQAIDYRSRYSMAADAVLEAVYPSWILGGIRADLARRRGWDTPGSAFRITNADIAAWFTERRISAQFVDDYQVRGASQFGNGSTAMTAWPTSIDFLLYAAGTWVRGNGMSLDLGVVRDSTLNSTNDHTAAWSEEALLVAEIGHESRVVTVPICPDGSVGPDTYASCPC